MHTNLHTNTRWQKVEGPHSSSLLYKEDLFFGNRHEVAICCGAGCSCVEMLPKLTIVCCRSGHLVGASRTVTGRLRSPPGLGAACDQHLSISSTSWNSNGESKTSCWPDESQLVSIFWCIFFPLLPPQLSSLCRSEESAGDGVGRATLFSSGLMNPWGSLAAC